MTRYEIRVKGLQELRDRFRGEEASPDEARFEALLTQYKLVSEDIRAFMATNDRLMWIGFSILGAGYSFGIQQDVPEVLVALPFAAFAILYYIVFLYTNILVLGGYKLAVEEEINRHLGRNVLAWEGSAAKAVRYPFSVIMLALTYVVFLLIIVYYAAGAAGRLADGQRDAWPYVELFLSTILMLAVGLLVSCRTMARAYDDAFSAATEYTRNGTQSA